MDQFLHKLIYFQAFSVIAPAILFVFILTVWSSNGPKYESRAPLFLGSYYGVVIFFYIFMFTGGIDLLRKQYISYNEYKLNEVGDVLSPSGYFNGKVRIVEIVLHDGTSYFRTEVLKYWRIDREFHWEENEKSFSSLTPALDYHDSINSAIFDVVAIKYDELVDNKYIVDESVIVVE